jgi:PAS domain S-box-containing protein
MNDSILVNLHVHSNFSDGDQTPETLAAGLAAARVRFVALTDHDTLEGLPRFQEALRRSGIASLPGLELTTRYDGRELHLLAYGFDPQHPELAATLQSLRQAKGLEVHSIAGSLRKAGTGPAVEAGTQTSLSAAPNGILDTGQAIDLIHRAGGKAFWAHPLLFESDGEKFEHLLADLSIRGLDGIEAIYPSFTPEQRARLLSLAHTYDLLVCAGTDYHTSQSTGGQTWGIEMPRAEWSRFRSAVFSGFLLAPDDLSSGAKANPGRLPKVETSPRHHTFRRRSFILRIFLPTFIVIGLFLGAFWGIILPSFENTLLERKREMIRELTNSAWSILASYHRDEENGLLTRAEAQRLAVTRVEALRYGADGKDYFWIQDATPRMIMHPYRTDLNGQDLSNFTDSNGLRVFVEFADLVKRQQEGYVAYVWQWKDDPLRLEPKESFVKAFAPWGWIIGTGIYIDDVNREIARIETSLINTSLAISGVIVILLVFVLQQSLRIERERQKVVDNLRESTDRYHALVEATSEGTLLVLDERCRYANPTFLQLLGYTSRRPGELEFLDLVDVLPRVADNAEVWERIEALNRAQTADDISPAADEGLEGCLQRSDGSLTECILALNPIHYAGQHGFILLARDITRQPDAQIHEGLALAVQSAPVGIFRARPARRGVFLELNLTARAFLAYLKLPENSQPALADLFFDVSEFEQLLGNLLAGGQVEDHILHIESSSAEARFLSLTAVLIRDEQGQPAYISGLLADVTDARKLEIERETQIEKLQSSLLFLHQPLSTLGREAVVCPLDTTIEDLSRRMTTHQATAALAASHNGTAIGIVTDHDLRARVLAGGVILSAPIHTIMSAPLIKISERASIYEALMRMEEHGVRHLAVEDENGEIVNVVDSKSLIQFQRYGPIVLTREIAASQTPQAVAHGCELTTPLVKTLMDSSARPRHVTNMLASVCDTASERLIELALADLGPPPAPFAFIAMGSQGRQEQTLLTDQDNGIIYSLAPDQDPAAAAQYFLRLGALVCEGLDRAGYTVCRGGVMARNPRWCRCLPDWIAGFDEWVRKPEQQEIIDLSIFFDFRTVYGEADLARELRRHIHVVLGDNPAFFPHFAQNALLFKPPFRLLGNIYLSSGPGEHVGEINLKDAMMPIVSFARLYALRHEVPQTHTIERIDALAKRGILLASSRDEITAAYDFLMQTRLQTQIAALHAGRPPQNTVQLAKLGYIQKELLKQAFAQIAAVQKKVSYDFLGGM